jgi:hypothetical protein
MFVSLVSLGNYGPFTLLIGPLKQQKDECSTQGIAVDGGRAKSREKDYSSVILNFIHLTCTAVRFNSSLCSKKLANNSLHYDMGHLALNI